VEGLLDSPVRSGLVGLAVAGTAAPIALSHYQNELRTDETHEATAPEGNADSSPEGVAAAWRDMEGQDRAEARDRESVIQQSMERYAEFSLTRQLAEQIFDAATLNQIDPEVAFGLVRAESSFKNTSTSEVGAIGLTQLMPKTAEFLEPGISRSELREPSTNLRIGFSYLRSLIDKYEGDEDLALLAYNRGPGTVDKALGRGEDPNNGYADFVRGKEGHGHSLYSR
jgi:soluble lytic murein transglycosylase-like protein